MIQNGHSNAKIDQLAEGLIDDCNEDLIQKSAKCRDAKLCTCKIYFYKMYNRIYGK